MKHKKILAGLVAGVALLSLAACGNNSSSSGSGLSGKITAGGSTALQPLVQAASTEFMTKNPQLQITVQGGGSGVGLTSVSSGAFQVGNSDIFAEQKSGIDASKLADTSVAVVGFAPIVNSNSTGVTKLTQQQLIDIFTGKVTNWKQVGGKNKAITVIERSAGSGTRVNFDQFALNNGAEVGSAAQTDSTGAVATQVAQTPGAISYVAFSGLSSSGITALSIDFGKGAVKPTDANVETNSWPVWGYEHMYTLKSNTTSAEKAFIKYVASDTADMKKLGFIQESAMKGTRSATGTWTAK